MATIAENLQTIKDSTAAIKQSIINKGGTISGNITTWASAIDGIDTCEVVPTLEEKDVNFYDYDGTLLFAYTLEEAQALTELPTPKGHSGLVFDGWNWDYEDVIALDYPMNIGAMYRTDDGKTRLYLKVEKPTSISLTFKNSGTATVDFGDGEVVETSEATPVLPHTYDVGEYVLKIDGTKTYEFNTDASVRNIIGEFSAASSGMIRKVEIGSRCTITTGAFKGCYNMETITLPSAMVWAGWTETYMSSGLKHFNLPKNCSIFVSGLSSTSQLRMVCLPTNPSYLSMNFIAYCGIEKLAICDSVSVLNSVEASCLRKIRWPSASTLPNRAFAQCYFLEEVILPDSITILPSSTFQECRCLRTFNMPSALESIGNGAMYRCSSLYRIPPFPSTLKSIDTNAFFQSTVKMFDFSACAQVPTLANANAFGHTSGGIVVPDALYDEWIAATNWSTYADRIVKASEYVETN